MDTAKLKGFGSIPSATGGIARLACARLREAGKNVAAVLSRAGLSVEHINDPTTRLEVRAQIKFLELAAQELQDDLFGFHLARSFDLREIGLVYYIIASSEQLADALRNCERYSKINNEGVHLQFNLDRTADIVLDHVTINRWSDRQHLEFWLVTLVRICRQITDSRLVPERLRVRHLRTDAPAEFKSFFGTSAEFNADADEISFSRQTASIPIIERDTYLNKLLRRYAEEALARRPGLPTNCRSMVEKELVQLLPHGNAKASHVARRLGMSSRTLSRKLSGEGMTFGEILDELKAALAKRYLSDRELPVSGIAWLLGYQEIGSFTHAFKRWTGMTPSRFRSNAHNRTAGSSEAPKGQ
jgi:AraC-like DNA-binding protein